MNKFRVKTAITLAISLVAAVAFIVPSQVTAQENMVIENNNAFLMAMGPGSRVEIHGADAQKQTWTQLAESTFVGSTHIVVQDATTGWEVGDRIAVAGTSNDWTQAEEFTIAAISGRTITLDTPLQYFHRAETLRYNNGKSGQDFREWTIEARAEVALLSRNITIQGDAGSARNGFGGHTMIMNGAEQHIEGAEFYRMGQRDRVGRYPIHWHMLGQTQGQYVQNVSVHNSFQKGATIHGTSNVRLEDTVIYDHVGHGVFLEDGSENDNQILGNLVFSTQRSETGLPIPTDADHASSYWIENPNNVIIGNHAAGSESNGFWIFENEVHGLSASTNVGASGDLSDLIFINNTSHTTSGIVADGGTDKILGIDGFVTDDLNWSERTLTGDFGVIEGFTGYSGPAWALTHELVFSNSAFMNSRFFARHENYIEDTVFDNVDVILYRDGGNQYNNVHAVGGSEFSLLGSHHANTAHALNNVTLGDAVIDFQGGAQGGPLDQQAIVDIDGSVTGVAGGFISPSNDRFRTAPGAVAAPGGLVSNFTVGATEVTARGIDGDLDILRSDGQRFNNVPDSKDSRQVGDDPGDQSDANKEFSTPVGMKRDLAYLLNFDDMPAELRLNLTGVRDGDSAVYQIPGIAGSFRVTEGGQRVQSFEELLHADVTSYFRRGANVFVRIVAVDNGVDRGRNVTDLLSSYRASDSITMTISDFSGSNGRLAQELITAIAESAPDGLNNAEPAIFQPRAAQTANSYRGAGQAQDVIDDIADAAPRSNPPANLRAPAEHASANYQLSRYPSGSVPVAVTNRMARWSDNIWGGNTPGADDIVVINQGQTVVLDESTTVGGIIVNGGRLMVEDGANLDIDLSTDYLLVINGGLFQAGTETNLLDTDFTLTLEGDDPNFDLRVGAILNGAIDSVQPVSQQEALAAEPTGSIAGTVVSAKTGDPIADAAVCAVADPPNANRCTTTAADGSYQINGLIAGSYGMLAHDAPQFRFFASCTDRPCSPPRADFPSTLRMNFELRPAPG